MNKFHLFDGWGPIFLWCGSQIIFDDLRFQHLAFVCLYNFFVFMHFCSFVNIVFGFGF